MQLATTEVQSITAQMVRPRPIEGARAEAVAVEALESLREDHPWLCAAFGPFAWLGPLVEAAHKRASKEYGARWITQWVAGIEGGDWAPDPEKHAAYVAYVSSVLGELVPFLPTLLDSACALVVVYPGYAAYAVDTRPGYLFPMHPEVVRRTELLPWAENELKH